MTEHKSQTGRHDTGIAAEAPASYAATSPYKMINVKEVAEMLGCSTRHVYRLADGGKMPPPHKPGEINR